MTRSEYEEMIRTLMWDYAAFLTDEELNFLHSLCVWIERATPTPKQITKLRAIDDRVTWEVDEHMDDDYMDDD